MKRQDLEAMRALSSGSPRERYWLRASTCRRLPSRSKTAGSVAMTRVRLQMFRHPRLKPRPEAAEPTVSQAMRLLELPTVLVRNHLPPPQPPHPVPLR